MLLEFSVDNFLSFKDKVTFSMAAAYDEDRNNTKKLLGKSKYSILKSAVIYGANASGKSNLLKAMRFMRSMVLNEKKVIQSIDKLDHLPFRLSSSTEHAPSTFEIVFFVNDVKYRYGFEADDSTVYSEWLFTAKSQKESKLFERNFDDLDDFVNPIAFKEGLIFFDEKKSKIKIAKNNLFLWKCDQEEGVISAIIFKWFKEFGFISGLNGNQHIDHTISKIRDDKFRDKVFDLMKKADIGIFGISLEETDIPSHVLDSLPFSEELKKSIAGQKVKNSIVKMGHKKFNEQNEEIAEVLFNLNNEESEGTKKLFAISAPILESLSKGKTVVIDELETSLHPNLTKNLVRLFNDKTLNSNGAQLIFVSHDSNLLNTNLFRKDQIWFVEKDKFGVSSLFSLAEFKNLRKNMPKLEQNYLDGDFGGVPYLSNFGF